MRCAIVFSKLGKFLLSRGKRCAMGVGQVHVRWGKIPRRVVVGTMNVPWTNALSTKQPHPQKEAGELPWRSLNPSLRPIGSSRSSSSSRRSTVVVVVVVLVVVVVVVVVDKSM